MRAYTLAEIDWMRDQLLRTVGRDFAEGNMDHQARVENRLRTYLQAGIEPSALDAGERGIVRVRPTPATQDG